MRVCVGLPVGGLQALRHRVQRPAEACLFMCILFLIIELNTSYENLKQFRIVYFDTPQKITSQDGLLPPRVAVLPVSHAPWAWGLCPPEGTDVRLHVGCSPPAPVLAFLVKLPGMVSPS